MHFCTDCKQFIPGACDGAPTVTRNPALSEWDNGNPRSLGDDDIRSDTTFSTEYGYIEVRTCPDCYGWGCHRCADMADPNGAE